MKITDDDLKRMMRIKEELKNEKLGRIYREDGVFLFEKLVEASDEIIRLSNHILAMIEEQKKRDC